MSRSSAWVLALVGVLALLAVGLWAARRDEHAEAGGRADVARSAAQPDRTSASAARPLGTVPEPSAEPARIRGRIVDLETGPLTEGRIDLYCIGDVYQSSARIGEEGQFELAACVSGPSCLRLVHPGFEQPTAWELDEPAVVELEAQTAPEIVGTIRESADAGVAAAELVVRAGESSFVTTSDADGEYAVALPRPRPCDRCDGADERACRAEHADTVTTADMLVTAPGFSPAAFTLELPVPGPFDVMLAPPAPELRGRVLSVDGEPFDDRTRVLASHRSRDLERHAASVDAEGRFAFRGLADAGEYSLRAVRDGREIASLELARPGDQVVLRSELSAAGAELTVELVDAEGQPIVGARVDGGPFRAAISDSEGRVAAPRVLSGSYTVRVRTPECGPVREAIELEPDASAWLRRVDLPENC